MSGKCQVVSHSCHGSYQVGAGTQMGYFSQILVGVSLFSEGIFTRIACSDYLAIVTTVRSRHLKLKELSLSRTLNKSTLDLETSADISLGNFLKAFDIFSNDNLKRFQAGAIADLNEAEFFASLSHASRPTSNCDDLVHELFVRVEQFSNAETMTI